MIHASTHIARFTQESKSRSRDFSGLNTCAAVDLLFATMHSLVCSPALLPSLPLSFRCPIPGPSHAYIEDVIPSYLIHYFIQRSAWNDRTSPGLNSRRCRERIFRSHLHLGIPCSVHVSHFRIRCKFTRSHRGPQIRG